MNSDWPFNTWIDRVVNRLRLQDGLGEVGKNGGQGLWPIKHVVEDFNGAHNGVFGDIRETKLVGMFRVRGEFTIYWGA